MEKLRTWIGLMLLAAVLFATAPGRSCHAMAAQPQVTTAQAQSAVDVPPCHKAKAVEYQQAIGDHHCGKTGCACGMMQSVFTVPEVVLALSAQTGLSYRGVADVAVAPIPYTFTRPPRSHS